LAQLIVDKGLMPGTAWDSAALGDWPKGVGDASKLDKKSDKIDLRLAPGPEKLPRGGQLDH